MTLRNYIEYAAFNYKNTFQGTPKFVLGNVVINQDNEIGVIIQIQSNTDFRTDMFGNCQADEIRMATDEEIQKFRPNILSENTLGKLSHCFK